MQHSHWTSLDRIARSQYGLITWPQAVESLGASRTQRLVRTRRLRRVQPRVLRVAGAPTSWHQELMAAQLSADGVVSHRSAAHLWGLLDGEGAVEVSVPPSKRPRLWTPATSHRILDLRPDLAVRRAGLWITDPMRTVIDLGLVASRQTVADALAVGLSSKLFPLAAIERLREALSRRGRDGVGVAREVLDDIDVRIQPSPSVLEARFAGLVRRRGLPTPAYQYEVWHEGQFIARVDAAYPDRRLAIEVDGFAAHSSVEAFQHDRTRQNALVAAGWTVLRFTWRDVVRRPAAVSNQIWQWLSVDASGFSGR